MKKFGAFVFVLIVTLVLLASIVCAAVITKPFKEVTSFEYNNFGGWVESADLGIKGGYYVNQKYVVNTEFFLSPHLQFEWSIQNGYQWKRLSLSAEDGISFKSNAQNVDP